MIEAIQEILQSIPPASAVLLVGAFMIWHHTDDKKQRKEIKDNYVMKDWMALYDEKQDEAHEVIVKTLERLEKKVDKRNGK